MMYKAKTAKSTVIPLLTLGVLTVKSISHYRYFGIVLDKSFQLTKTFRDNYDSNILH